MYKYRAVEYPQGNSAILHQEFESEEDAKKDAKRIVAETHNTCFIERYNAKQWERGSIRYFWSFDHVCFWNHR